MQTGQSLDYIEVELIAEMIGYSKNIIDQWLLVIITRRYHRCISYLEDIIDVYYIIDVYHTQKIS